MTQSSIISQIYLSTEPIIYIINNISQNNGVIEGINEISHARTRVRYLEVIF